MPGIARLVACAAALLLFAPRAEAANCTIATTSTAFGTYNVFATAPTDSTGTIVIRCQGGKDIAISINRGGSSTFERRMVNGTEELLYNLYLDAARTLVWGDGTGGTQVSVEDPPNNKDLPLTIYARVPAGQDVAAGAYIDTATVSVNF
jgi:spore coat protein U-like protein